MTTSTSFSREHHVISEWLLIGGILFLGAVAFFAALTYTVQDGLSRQGELIFWMNMALGIFIVSAGFLTKGSILESFATSIFVKSLGFVFITMAIGCMLIGYVKALQIWH